MPLIFLNKLTGKDRTQRANRQLGGLLAFVAGAINAGGFLAVQRYTSHMTGIVSAIADDLVLGQIGLVLAGIALLSAFIAGAMCTAVLINWARGHRLHSEFSLPLIVEAVLLLVFGLLGANLNTLVELFVPTTVLLLCFIMGLQNAVITKISRAEIRTTHMTGVITDLGIELGRLVYWNKGSRAAGPVRADRERLVVLSTILGLFVVGAIIGAWSFKAIGYSAVLPIATLLVAISVMPLVRDFADLKQASD
ncbi:MAG: YoaK family protein [Pseudomonadota bacterium]